MEKLSGSVANPDRPGAMDDICKAEQRPEMNLSESRGLQYIPKHIANMSDKTGIGGRALERYTVGKPLSRRWQPSPAFGPFWRA
ncbi:MAG: hypothetical protein RL189_1776 [Pseudomonadota bacterium]|jgi:hypothetical protein